MSNNQQALVAPTERQRFEEAVLALKGRLQHRRKEDILCMFLSSSTLTRSIVSTQLKHLTWRVDDAARLVDATHTIRQRMAFVMRNAADPILRESARLVVSGGKVGDEMESQDVITTASATTAGSNIVQQPSQQSTSSLLRKKIPAQDYSQLVLVDALVHENYLEVATQLREIEHEVGGTLILVLLTEPRPAEGLGMRLLPELSLSVAEGYSAGYDLVLPKHFDHTVALFLTELFLSASGRWQKLNSQVASNGMANYNRIRHVLGDVTDWKPQGGNDGSSPNNNSPNGLVKKEPNSSNNQSVSSPTFGHSSSPSSPRTLFAGRQQNENEEKLLAMKVQKLKTQIKLLIKFIQDSGMVKPVAATATPQSNSISSPTTNKTRTYDPSSNLANQLMVDPTANNASIVTLGSVRSSPSSPVVARQVGAAASVPVVGVTSLNASLLATGANTANNKSVVNIGSGILQSALAGSRSPLMMSSASAGSPTNKPYQLMSIDELLMQVKVDEEEETKRNEQQHSLDCVDTNPEFVKLMARYEASLSTLQRLQEKHKLLTESRQFLQTQFTAMKADLSDVRSQLENALEQLRLLRGEGESDRNSIENELETAKQNRVHDAGTINSLSKQIGKLRQRIAEAQEELEALEKSKADQAKQISKLTEALEDARETSAKGVNGTRAALEATNDTQSELIQRLTELLLDSRDTFNGLPGALRKRKEAEALANLLNGELAALLLGKLRSGSSIVSLQQLRKFQQATSRALRAEDRCAKLESMLMGLHEEIFGDDWRPDSDPQKRKQETGEDKIDALSESQFNEIMSHVREGRVAKVSKLLYLRGDKVDKWCTVRESDFPSAVGDQDEATDLGGPTTESSASATTDAKATQTDGNHKTAQVINKYLSDAQLLEMFNSINELIRNEESNGSELQESEILLRLRDIQFQLVPAAATEPVNSAPNPPSTLPPKKSFQRQKPEDIRKAEEAKFLNTFNGLQPHALPSAISSPYYRLKK